MKKVFAFILALTFLSLPALAEYAAQPFAAEENVYYTIDSYTGALIGSDSEYREAVYSADGTKLSADYDSITSISDDYALLEVANSDKSAPVGRLYGVIDLAGNEILPVQYHDVDVRSPRWILGIMMSETTKDDANYQVFGDTDAYYKIDSVDVYFDGQLVNTVDRDVYGGYGYAYGAYFYAQGNDGQSSFINGAGEVQAISGYGEYDTKYEDDTVTYTHVPTGQKAFVPECTLAADDVDQPYLLDGTRLLDLQGNVVCEYPQEYGSTPDFKDGIAAVYGNEDYDKYGVVNLNGEEIIPLAYENAYSAIDELARYGCSFFEKDGQYGALDLAGNETVPFQYDADSLYPDGPFLRISNEDDTYTVVSALVGELPDHYEYADCRGCAVIVDGVGGGKGLILLDGEALIPMSADIQDISCAYDGSRILVQYESGDYQLYEKQ